MVCESVRQSWTVLNWAVRDQSPDSWSCMGFSPRCKSLRRESGGVLIEGRSLWCYSLLWVCLKRCTFDLSLPELFTPQSRGNYYQNGRGFCWLQPGVFLHTADSQAGLTTYRLQMRIKKVLRAWVCTLEWWWLISTSFLIIVFQFLLWTAGLHTLHEDVWLMWKCGFLSFKKNKPPMGQTSVCLQPDGFFYWGWGGGW